LQEILDSLQKLKDTGHENPPTIRQKIYNLFRRCLPNWNREENLSKLDQILKEAQDTESAVKFEAEKKEQEDIQAEMAEARRASEPQWEARKLAISFVTGEYNASLQNLKKLLDKHSDDRKIEIITKWVFHINNEFRVQNHKYQEDKRAPEELKILVINAAHELVKACEDLKVANVKTSSGILYPYLQAHEEYLKNLKTNPGLLSLSEAVLVCHFEENPKILFRHIMSRDDADPYRMEVLIASMPKEKLLKIVPQFNIQKILAKAEELEVNAKAKNPERTYTEHGYSACKPDETVYNMNFLLERLYPIYMQMSDEDRKKHFGEEFQMRSVFYESEEKEMYSGIQMSFNQGTSWQLHRA
jgi:hypothetical protein